MEGNTKFEIYILGGFSVNIQSNWLIWEQIVKTWIYSRRLKVVVEQKNEYKMLIDA